MLDFINILPCYDLKYYIVVIILVIPLQVKQKNNQIHIISNLYNYKIPESVRISLKQHSLRVSALRNLWRRVLEWSIEVEWTCIMSLTKHYERGYVLQFRSLNVIS